MGLGLLPQRSWNGVPPMLSNEGRLELELVSHILHRSGQGSVRLQPRQTGNEIRGELIQPQPPRSSVTSWPCFSPGLVCLSITGARVPALTPACWRSVVANLLMKSLNRGFSPTKENTKTKGAQRNNGQCFPILVFPPYQYLHGIPLIPTILDLLCFFLLKINNYI